MREQPRFPGDDGPQASDEHQTSREEASVDAALRRALEPDRATVERLITRTLAESKPWSGSVSRWTLATALTAMVLAALILPIWRSETRPPIPATRPTESPAASIRPPVALRISNEQGPVIVTSRAGSKMVVLPPELARPHSGDDS